MPRPSRAFGFGMMWKCTWSIAWCALVPLFSSTLYSLTPVAATTARHSRGSTRPSAAADSSERRSRVSAGSFGTTSVCPSASGLISRNARTFSSSYTLLQGISPRTILPNIVSAMRPPSQGIEISPHCRSGWAHHRKRFMKAIAGRIFRGARVSERSWCMSNPDYAHCAHRGERAYGVGSMRSAARFLALLALWTGSVAANYPPPTEGDFIAREFRFTSGEALPELRIHYRAFGQPRTDRNGIVRNAVLIMHGTGGSGASLLREIGR